MGPFARMQGRRCNSAQIGSDAPKLRGDERCDSDPDEDVRSDQIMDAQDGDAFGCEQHEERGARCPSESGVAFDASRRERDVGILPIDHWVGHERLLARTRRHSHDNDIPANRCAGPKRFLETS